MLDVVREVCATLQALPSVECVELEERPKCSAASIAEWERQHSPLRLPNDYKARRLAPRAFLLSSDGLLLRWSVLHCRQRLPIGHMHLARLADLRPVPDSAFLTATGERRPELPSEAQLRAVELDASTSSGRVCLLYAGGEGRAQVWFQDASCSWSFIASSFVDYFRLMVLHRGLPRWQYQYTDAGLDSVAKAWWRAFAADRCGSDTENRAQQVEYDGEGRIRELAPGKRAARAV
ncbi:hypothetical protein EMIHUDRAFT_231097 [Emiliania huxleyi CCMP1516]|uniref:Knr4/Smi1-like domain-containing protein n=2 Tax=Emiliania huxleyi TaxID=2903 RepID=A0A0D3K996_EMIH1|nr:hypothetical protein EMIHUDRAFT_232403 [Emiliania huxleyi CCMP1516]XP_005784760.1 hypothetical protein EMIHUDRAFT_231097 [Emiliania huxleyi CCMP1516]EOD30802.1 hypothetical protein EMIHUDRAFT_232403 [Emiliania huxleyi CCMP1516]EOD32331.1 hypothetical protein EMIHUDRAFT_231097 [Emiliania huxleyi CCMP1516]|eukprot:XP_005783231.1 hypothetical protein EMIHUDRAFT_232403 [Emiliania huxleyi CCMP1516]